MASNNHEYHLWQTDVPLFMSFPPNGRNKKGYYEQIDSTSFTVFGIGLPRTLCPFSVIKTLSSLLMPPIDIRPSILLELMYSVNFPSAFHFAINSGMKSHPGSTVKT